MTRLSRMEYAVAVLFQVVGIVLASLFLDKRPQTSGELTVAVIIAVGTLILTYVTTVARLRDAGWSQFLVVFIIFPIVGIIFQFILIFAPTKSLNNYRNPNELNPDQIHKSMKSTSKTNFYTNTGPSIQPGDFQKTETKPEESVSISDEAWQAAYEEFHSNNRDIALYAKLYAWYDGDEKKITAHYLRDRATFFNNSVNPTKMEQNTSNFPPLLLDEVSHTGNTVTESPKSNESYLSNQKQSNESFTTFAFVAFICILFGLITWLSKF